ncbi:MAG: hypothetical protein EA401_11705 [Planctomycetota bacterium]|nr:MAG: hypothetical protein EA401_11705 [Planctomycetota bacterium]
MAAQDPHAKQLLTRYPQATLELFAPDLIREHGPAQGIESVSTEIFPLDVDKAHGGFLDVALKCSFADGSEHILLLIEHWSLRRGVDYRRTCRYVIELLCRHPQSLVLPILLVTDPSLAEVADRFHYAIGGQTVFDVHFHLAHVNLDWRTSLAIRKNVVATVLWVVANIGDPVERCAESVRKLKGIQASWPSDEIALLIAHMEKLARLNHQQADRFRRHLREDPEMTSVVDLLKEDFRAEGKAEGKAEGEIHALLSLVNKGIVTPDIARAQLAEWLAEGDIPQGMYDEALVKLQKPSL